MYGIKAGTCLMIEPKGSEAGYIDLRVPVGRPYDLLFLLLLLLLLTSLSENRIYEMSSTGSRILHALMVGE
jgi:hypothetical protein